MFSMSHNLSINLGLNMVFSYRYYGNIWSVLSLKPISVATYNWAEPIYETYVHLSVHTEAHKTVTIFILCVMII